MSSLDDFLVLFLVLTLLPIGSGFYTALATTMLLPIYASVLASGTLEGTKSYFGVVTGFVISYTFFALLFSVIIYFLYVPSNVVRIIAIIASISFGLLMIFSKKIYVNFLNHQKSGFSNGLFYGSLLGLIWSFWVGPFMPQLDYYAPKSIDFYLTCLTLMFGVGVGLFILIISYLIHKVIYWIKLPLKDINILRKVFGSLMVMINLAIAFGLITIPKREELKHPEPYVPLNEIFHLEERK